MTRLCACGCGHSLEARRPNVRWFSPDCLNRVRRQCREQDEGMSDILRGDPCSYCGSQGSEKRGSVGVDHIDALAEGGEPGWTNLTSACFICNSGKGGHETLLSFLLRGVPF